MRVALYSTLLFAISLFADAYAQTPISQVNPKSCRWAHIGTNRPRVAPLGSDGCVAIVDCGGLRETIRCRPIRRSSITTCPDVVACVTEYQETERARLARSSTRTSGGEETTEAAGPQPAGTKPPAAAAGSTDPFEHGIPGDTHGY